MLDDIAKKRIEAKEKKRDKLEAGNERSYTELVRFVHEKTGQGFQMDTSGARLEMFIGLMIDKGLITLEDKIDFDIAFHERVDEQLSAEWTNIKEAIARYEKQREQQRLLVPPSSPGLIDINGKRLN